MIIGYARVSTSDQNLDRQIDQLREQGCGRIYQEKITGTSKERPELNRMFEALREGIIQHHSGLSKPAEHLTSQR